MLSIVYTIFYCESHGQGFIIENWRNAIPLNYCMGEEYGCIIQNCGELRLQGRQLDATMCIVNQEWLDIRADGWFMRYFADEIYRDDVKQRVEQVSNVVRDYFTDNAP